MKTNVLLLSLSLGLLAGCSSPSDQTQVSAPTSVAQQASASGVVTAVDTTAKKLTIQHGPVAALEWPAMTMNFQAPNIDLDTVKVGDRVSFEFTSSGMDATITTLTQESEAPN